MGTTPGALVKRSPTLAIRAVRFEDVAGILRLIARAIEGGCRAHYDPAQRAAVFQGYASVLFVEAMGPYETLAAVLDGQLVGFAQLDASNGRLRALFVDARVQGHGVGRALLADVEARAALRGRARVHGAMSLNAVPFYERVGFRPCAAPERLTTAGIPLPIVRMEKRLR
jgi:GNAT superfamily N-acetyltransferase